MRKLKDVIDKIKSAEDLGLDKGFQTGRQRSINRDGSFNMERKTGRFLGGFNAFRWIITTSWLRYWLIVFGFYGVMNVIFASIYYSIGVDQLHGIQGNDALTHWLYCFFFSAQSFTTVGYGAINPISEITNFIATIEAFIGLMTFALATGTLYGRFSKPVTKLKYSSNILIAPYKDITGMQFMVANEQDSTLMDMEARVNSSYMALDDYGNPVRKFQFVKLEIDKITMFPTSWIINHPIEEDSALFGKSIQEIIEMDFEIFILIKGFDDVFSQTIYSRHSFTGDSFVWGAKFKKPFYINEKGKTVLDLTKVGDYDLIDIPDKKTV